MILTLRRLDNVQAVSNEEIDATIAQEESIRRGTRVAKLATRLGARYGPAAATLDRFRIYDGKQRAVIARLRAIGDRLDELTAAGRGIVLFGSVGTGKDHLAAAMLYAAIDRFGITAEWINGRDIFGASRAAMSEDRSEATVIRPLVQPQILCISDVLPVAGSLSDWNLDLLYRIFDSRYREMRPTWLTMNVVDEEDAKGRLLPPLWRRVKEGAELVPCFWPMYAGQKPMVADKSGS